MIPNQFVLVLLETDIPVQYKGSCTSKNEYARLYGTGNE